MLHENIFQADANVQPSIDIVQFVTVTKAQVFIHTIVLVSDVSVAHSSLHVREANDRTSGILSVTSIVAKKLK